jgi:hypothetical protein
MKGPFKALVVVGSLALLFAGWIFFNRLHDLGYVDSAIGSMRGLVASEAKFAQAHPGIGYTCTLSALPPNDLTAELVRNARRNGYAFEIIGCSAEGGKMPNAKYQVVARPLFSRLPAFCSDQSGVLRSDEGGSVQKCLESGIPVG